jgi:hypothetical protein
LLSQPRKLYYGLIGNIYIRGTCSTALQEIERKVDDEDCLKEEEILIYRKYQRYKK